MLSLSSDPIEAERQLRAVIFYLTAFGYIDGHFDPAERELVRNYIRDRVEHRVREFEGELDEATAQHRIGRYVTHFDKVFEGIDGQVADLLNEVVSRDETQMHFAEVRLKQRCFEIFQTFDEPSQQHLMETIDEMLMADGKAHPAELRFRRELDELLHQQLPAEPDSTGATPVVEIRPEEVRPVPSTSTSFFDRFEHHYSKDEAKIRRQVQADLELVDRAIGVLTDQANKGAGRLAGKQTVDELSGMGPFLDGHTYVLQPDPGSRYELTVVGDLHGCYSCLKAAVMQSRFFERLAAWRDNPLGNPEPKLVFLGDYIDRGIYSMNGVLRSLLLLLCTAPEHVYLLRGNHEYFVEHDGEIYGGVKPSEAIDTLKPYLQTDSTEVFRRYGQLFERLPNCLLFDRCLFVHGGIPRDSTIDERMVDLSSLNDPVIRFQMMWSDPSTTEAIPRILQDSSARFSFGHAQARRFLEGIGCNMLVRGHEKIVEGFRRVYDDDLVLLSLFSSGGSDNDDLPSYSSYRGVTPKAMTLEYAGGKNVVTPWPIEYAHYNDPSRNAFFQKPPEIRHGG